MTLGTIRPPLSLTPFGAVGTAAWVRVGRGRCLSRARRGRCLAVGADCGRSDGRSRNELRPRMALGATLTRPTFMARLARMLVATDRPPNLDEFLRRKFRLGRRLRGRLRHRDVLRHFFGRRGDGKGWRLCDTDPHLRRVGEHRRARLLDRLVRRGCRRFDHRVFDRRRICRRAAVISTEGSGLGSPSNAGAGATASSVETACASVACAEGAAGDVDSTGAGGNSAGFGRFSMR